MKLIHWEVLLGFLGMILAIITAIRSGFRQSIKNAIGLESRLTTLEVQQKTLNDKIGYLSNSITKVITKIFKEDV